MEKVLQTLFIYSETIKYKQYQISHNNVMLNCNTLGFYDEMVIKMWQNDVFISYPNTQKRTKIDLHIYVNHSLAFVYLWMNIKVWGLTLKQAEHRRKSVKGSDPKAIDKLVHLLFKAIFYAEYLSPCCERMEGTSLLLHQGPFFWCPSKWLH